MRAEIGLAVFELPPANVGHAVELDLRRHDRQWLLQFEAVLRERNIRRIFEARASIDRERIPVEMTVVILFGDERRADVLRRIRGSRRRELVFEVRGRPRIFRSTARL